MICPNCGVEYGPGLTQCSECLVALVDESKSAKPRWSRPVELVTVFKCGDDGRIALAKSLLRSAGIRFVVQNEAVQNLFGMASASFGGPAEFQVDREDAVDAKALLRDLESPREKSRDVEADDEGSS